jgi:hypothetical protein
MQCEGAAVTASTRGVRKGQASNAAAALNTHTHVPLAQPHPAPAPRVQKALLTVLNPDNPPRARPTFIGASPLTWSPSTSCLRPLSNPSTSCAGYWLSSSHTRTKGSAPRSAATSAVSCSAALSPSLTDSSTALFLSPLLLWLGLPREGPSTNVLCMLGSHALLRLQMSLLLLLLCPVPAPSLQCTPFSAAIV